MTRADAFNAAMKLWLELAEIDPESNFWNSTKNETERLIAMNEIDPSLVSSFFLLQALSDNYFEDRKVSIDDLDSDPDRVMAYMAKVREFRSIIKSDDLTAIGIEFEQSMTKALAHYGVPAEKIAELLSHKHNLAYLRRDALTSMERLKVSQFLSGEYDPKDTLPVYNPDVFSYWNMNSCIEHLCGMPSGMSMNLIRDPDELHSYFCITVRNGGNLITLSDVPEYAHPLGRYMSRRPDRAFSSRAGQNWFPYDLLNIKYDEEGNPYHDKYRESVEKGLVPHQPNFVKLKEVKDLDPAVVAWTIMVYDLIKERFWKSQPAPLPLSYTAEMIRVVDQNRLLGAAASNNLPVAGYQPIMLPELTAADVKTALLDETAIGVSAATTDSESFGTNQWMEDRYGDKVVDEVLNLIAAGDRAYFLTHDDEKYKPSWHGDDKSLIVQDSGIQSLTAREAESIGRFSGGSKTYRLRALDATAFGTREQLDADRKFLARHNFAKAIQREANREYEEKKEEMRAWVVERVKANFDELLRFTTVDKFLRTKEGTSFASPGRERYRFAATGPAYLTRSQRDSYEYETWARYDESIIEFPQRPANSWAEPSCYFNDTKAYWYTAIAPRTVEDLAFMCGCTVEELPPLLQNWRHRDCEPYTGNSILNRIDPLEWALTTPWEQEKWVVRIFLSKRARTKLQKELTPPVQEDVEDVADRPTVMRL